MQKSPVAESTQRRRYTYRGVVQGVGFRPTVFRCAVSLGLTGFVQNQRSVVVAEVQGPREKLGRCQEQLLAMLPTAALIDEISSTKLALRAEGGFRIAESQFQNSGNSKK